MNGEEKRAKGRRKRKAIDDDEAMAWTQAGQTMTAQTGHVSITLCFSILFRLLRCF